jgi:hypothetical protein
MSTEKSKSAAKENIRLYEPARKSWRRYADEIDLATESVSEPGCARAIESFLIAGLNATNLMLLTGAGSSFCIQNPADTKLTSKTAPGLGDLWTAVQDFAGREEFSKVIGIIPGGKDIRDIEKLLTQCKLYVALFGDSSGNGKDVAIFIRKAESAILARVDFVDERTDLTAHQSMLRKMARRGVRKPRTKVFSTNYDLAFEYAARSLRFVVVDGFSHAAPPVYDRANFGLDIVRREGAKDAPDYYENVVQLYKLHGSIDWRRTSADIVRGRGSEGEPVLIFPRDSKYQEAFHPPYLDMMSAFQTALREPDTTLFVAGFSFNDSHLAQPVLAALESNMSFKMLVCDPAFLPDEAIKENPILVAAGGEPANSFHKRLLRLADAGDQRIALVHGRFEDLSMVLPDLVAETERERHAQRLRGLNDPDPKSKAKP